MDTFAELKAGKTSHFRRATMNKDERFRNRESLQMQKVKQLQRRRSGDEMIAEQSYMSPEELSEQKRNMETKLHHDDRKVNQLTESLQLSNERTEEMLSIFDSFGQRLNFLETSTGPMHSATTSLTLIHANLEKTTQSFNELLAHYNVYNEVKDILKDNRQIGQNPQLYLDNLEKAIEAKVYFETNKLKSAEESLSLLKAVCIAGIVIIQKEFSFIAKSDSLAIHISRPIKENEVARLKLPPDIIKKLRDLADFLRFKAQDKSFTKPLEECRSECLFRSMLTLSQDEEVISDKQTSNKSRLQFSSFTDKADPNAHTQNKKTILHLNYDSSKLYDKGTHPFLEIIDLFTVLIQQERQIFTQILPDDEFSTFELAIAKPVELFVNTGDHFVKITESSIEKKEFSQIFGALDILEHLNAPEFLLVREHAGQSSSRLTYLNNIFMVTCARALNEFESDLKKTFQKVSQDGTVHAMTVKVLFFLQRLFDYNTTVDEVLKTAETFNQDSNHVGAYILRVLQELRSVLQTMAHQYIDKFNDKALQSIFLINNLNYILKNVRASAYGDIMGDSTSFTLILDGVMTAQIELYLSSWAKCISYIDMNNVDPSAKFSRNQKSEYKERFKGFNTEFEAICVKNKSYTVPDDELRQLLIDKIQDKIVPIYRNFRSSVDRVQFAKDSTKYAKYSIQSFRIEISRFFTGQ